MFQPEAAKPDHPHLVCTGCLCLLRLKLSLVHTEAHGLYQVGSHNPNSMNPSSGLEAAWPGLQRPRDRVIGN